MNINNINFGKPLQNLSEEDLFRLINNSEPRFGILAQYELMRRLSVEESKSSKRFAHATFYVSIVSILIALGIGAVQIYLQKIEISPILSQQQRNEKEAYNFCKEPGNQKNGWPSATGDQILCPQVLKMLEGKI